jgi:UDP-N-acetyl-D-galactosamine dehydrogenase
MNELSLIFDRVGIRTKDVLEAAGTKWNFLKFTPGLVGGHCIGVDPYYLTAKAQSLGYYPQVILSGRRINDGMGEHVAKKVIKLLIERDRPVRKAKIGILGLTFKEDVPDLRNSRVPDIIKALQEFGITPLVHDPLAEVEIANAAYGVNLVSREEVDECDALILAVPHKKYLAEKDALLDGLVEDGIFVDIKSAFDPDQVTKKGYRYWSL